MLQSVPAGIFAALTVLWCVWLIPFLVRVELSARLNEPVERLGLRWEAEGWAPVVAASGEVGGLRMRLRLRWSPIGPIMALEAGDSRYEGPEAEAALAELVARLRSPADALET